MRAALLSEGVRVRELPETFRSMAGTPAAGSAIGPETRLFLSVEESMPLEYLPKDVNPADFHPVRSFVFRLGEQPGEAAKIVGQIVLPARRKPALATETQK